MNYDLGTMPEWAKNRLVTALAGKTYMQFQIHWGAVPGGAGDVSVILSTQYDATADEALSFALSVLATTKGG